MSVTVWTIAASVGGFAVPAPVVYNNATSAELDGGCVTIAANGKTVALWGAGQWQHVEIKD